MDSCIRLALIETSNTSTSLSEQWTIKVNDSSYFPVRKNAVIW